MKEFQPPTPNAAPYGLVFDRHSGNIWYCDTVGNNIGRFDPKTEQFVEYALPTRNTSVRFMGVDRNGRGWYSGFWSGKIGVIDPEGSKQIAAAH
jgi:streptogramin lyase